MAFTIFGSDNYRVMFQYEPSDVNIRSIVFDALSRPEQPKIVIQYHHLEIYPVLWAGLPGIEIYFKGMLCGSIGPHHLGIDPQTGKKLASRFFKEALIGNLNCHIRNELGPNEKHFYHYTHDGQPSEYMAFVVEKIAETTFPEMVDRGLFDVNQASLTKPFERMYIAYTNFFKYPGNPITFKVFQQLSNDIPQLTLSRGNLILKKDTAILNGTNHPITDPKVKAYALKHLSPEDYMKYKQFREAAAINFV